uniref:Cas1p 10 TM acyl transferase domain-containing protein n=1 Tax=Polytomella parva TaxID=51329 RepID=A0A7S0UQ77_9CHLO|mmetsp:Transcript_12516/g.22401  ORF Transcript_12516/g.22401 Transcript_12516/m.22401 type:complete len:571 (+) Transcript_12516:246-1958(+)
MTHIFPGQVTFLIIYAIVLLLYALSEFFTWCYSTNVCSLKNAEFKKGLPNDKKGFASKPSVVVYDDFIPISVPNDSHLATPFSSILKENGMVRCLLLRRSELIAQRHNLKAMAQFGSLVFWLFLVDRVHLFPHTAKYYNRDLFYFIFSSIIISGFLSSIQISTSSSVILHRSQTEEWKGWMQILFVMYHYFNALEIYSVIRLCVASYVWMTGYGNFIYYYKHSSFDFNRFLQTMWRLNFLVFFVCLSLGNRIMLYYICPMHTLFTLLVMACLMIAPRLNKYSLGIWSKFFACFLFIFIVWENRKVFEAFWWPLHWLVGFSPGDPTKSTLVEWFVRSGFDRYIWIHGMICGYLHPYASALVNRFETLPIIRRTIIRTAGLTLCFIAGYFYYVNVLSLPRDKYMKLHPYTSWIPISLWIIVRNCTPTLRERHVRLLGWLGCITLETYVTQFHTWMMTNSPDFAPVGNLQLLSKKYPLLNFLFTTTVFVGVSWQLFELTVKLKGVALPSNMDSRILWRNLTLLVMFCSAIYFSVIGVMFMSKQTSGIGNLVSGNAPTNTSVSPPTVAGMVGTR